jgi:hypothetical protein
MNLFPRTSLCRGQEFLGRFLGLVCTHPGRRHLGTMGQGGGGQEGSCAQDQHGYQNLFFHVWSPVQVESGPPVSTVSHA